MYELAVLAIFKNEAMVIDEWIQHYLKEGVQHFYLIDNGSTDNSRDKLHAYSSYVTLFADSEPSQMVKLFNKYFMPQKQNVRWLAIVDFDEFLYARNGTLRDYVRTLKSNVGQVVTPFSFYGSSGLLQQPAQIVPHFLHRWRHDRRSPIETKGIVNCFRLQSLGLHFHITTGRNIGCDGIDVPVSSFITITPNLVDNAALQLNHYVVQSWEYFSTVKMKRPDGNSAANNGDRDKSFFDAHDHNEVFDDGLARKVYSNRVYRPELAQWDDTVSARSSKRRSRRVFRGRGVRRTWGSRSRRTGVKRSVGGIRKRTVQTRSTTAVRRSARLKMKMKMKMKIKNPSLKNPSVVRQSYFNLI